MALESTIAGTWYPGTARGIRAAAEKWESARVAGRAAARLVGLRREGLRELSVAMGCVSVLPGFSSQASVTAFFQTASTLSSRE